MQQFSLCFSFPLLLTEYKAVKEIKPFNIQRQIKSKSSQQILIGISNSNKEEKTHRNSVIKSNRDEERMGKAVN